MLPSALKSLNVGPSKPKAYAMHRINEDNESEDEGNRSFLAPRQQSRTAMPKNKFTNILLQAGGSKKRHRQQVSDDDADEEDDDDSFLLGDSFNGRGVNSGSAQPISDTPPRRYVPAVTEESSTPSRTQEPPAANEKQPTGIPLSGNKLMSVEEEKSRLAVAKNLKCSCFHVMSAEAVLMKYSNSRPDRVV